MGYLSYQLVQDFSHQQYHQLDPERTTEICMGFPSDGVGLQTSRCHLHTSKGGCDREGLVSKEKTGETNQTFFKKWVLRDFSSLTRCGNLIVLEIFQFNGSVLLANNILNDRSLRTTYRSTVAWISGLEFRINSSWIIIFFLNPQKHPISICELQNTDQKAPVHHIFLSQTSQ